MNPQDLQTSYLTNGIGSFAEVIKKIEPRADYPGSSKSHALKHPSVLLDSRNWSDGSRRSQPILLAVKMERGPRARESGGL